VFDREILDRLPSRADRRVEFIHASVMELAARLRASGGDLVVLHEKARDAVPALAQRLAVDALFANGDYEPDAIARDDAVEAALAATGRRMHRAKDQVLFEKDEVVTQAGRPYTVFTPYKRAWLAKLEPFYLEPYPVERHTAALAPAPFAHTLPSLAALGFESTNLAACGVIPGEKGALATVDAFTAKLDEYHVARDFPAIAGTSGLSVHNRFGTISVRELGRRASTRQGIGAATWLSELAWRDFFFQVLWHYPRVADGSFQPVYDRIAWPNAPALLDAWREGRTGYALVDAAMRQLAATGFMHNRLRMVVASFLCKDLLVDWRLGQRHFADHLNDYDLAANNGNWQWAASTGCDAQPYFRIFNPVTQSEKFDADGAFIRRHVPELAAVPGKRIHAPWTMTADEQRAAGCIIGRDYPAPVVDHATQRERALELYEAARSRA
jgi:deoxyribodipyrimidine photo-lyase